MPFTSQPSSSVSQALSVYAPIQYETDKSITIGSPVVILQARLTLSINGVPFVNPFTGNTVEISATPYQVVGTTYSFRFDVAGVLQKYLQPFGTELAPMFLNGTGFAENERCYANIEATVQYYYDSGTTTEVLTYAAGEDDTSNESLSLIAIQQLDEVSNLFGLSVYLTQDASQLFLTSSPQPTLSNPRSSLSYYNDVPTRDKNFFRVQTFTGTLDVPTLVFDGFVTTGISTFERLTSSISTGTERLSNPLIYWATNGATFDPTTFDFYSIQIGEYTGAIGVFNPAFFTEASAPYFYEKDTNCDKKADTLRLHFLNQYGGVDTIKLNGSIQKVEETSSDFIRRPKVNSFSPSQIVRSRHNIRSFQTYQFESGQYFSNEQFEWLRQLVRSAQTAMEVEISGSVFYIPIVIDTDSWLFYDNDDLERQLIFEFQKGFEVVTHS